MPLEGHPFVKGDLLRSHAYIRVFRSERASGCRQVEMRLLLSIVQQSFGNPVPMYTRMV
jgi:hypothetical protein